MSTASTSWTDGYVAELDYTHGYYREMAPLHLELAAISKMQAVSRARPLRYLELGFGQGLSLNIHAAATGGEYWGTDFNPTQAANAQEMARASGANVTVLDQSFAELHARTDLPQFDFIALHGIWSWISDENRKIIVDIARQRLAVGGLLYISYNTMPGWAAAIPLRHLMSLYLKLASGEAQGLRGRIDGALGFAEKVVDSNALYFRANPAVAERLKGMKGHNRHYLAHEFFNADWHPMPFSDAAALLEEAKLSFAASADLMAHIDAVNLTAQQQQLLAELNHPMLRESVRDYCENQQFRRDVFVKGARSITTQQQTETLRQWRFVLKTPRSDISLKIKGAAGEAQLQANVYDPLIEALGSQGYAPKSIEMLMADPVLKSISVAQISQALVVLTGLGYVGPAQSDAEIAAATKATTALNQHILEKAVYSADINFMASPVTGGGIAVGRIQQLVLRSIGRGKTTPEEWAQDIWPMIEAQGQRLMRDGKSLQTAAENIAELKSMGEEFARTRLPILVAMKVVAAPSSKTGGRRVGTAA